MCEAQEDKDEDDSQHREQKHCNTKAIDDTRILLILFIFNAKLIFDAISDFEVFQVLCKSNRSHHVQHALNEEGVANAP